MYFLLTMSRLAVKSLKRGPYYRHKHKHMQGKTNDNRKKSTEACDISIDISRIH